ncbi:MAG: hypothetical protein HPY79_00160 [Bacteroidales bacterium]|nr:hypothetical protein [Bacteroidales bacterium]
MKKIFILFTFLLSLGTIHAQFSITYETIDPTCYGQCNGKIKITSATGGVAPYTLNLVGYSMTINNYNGTDTVYFQDLCSGTYTVQITDANAQTISYQNNIIINDPQPITFNVTTTDVTCPGLCNGTAQVTILNGTPPYQIEYNGQYYNNGLFSDLCSGNYYLYINDANGCQLTDVSFEIYEPQPINVFFDSIIHPSNCTSLDGQLYANVTGGTSPYTFNWSTGNTSQTIIEIGTGIYHLTVTDANGCSKIAHYALNETTSNLNLMGFNPTCYGYSNGKIYMYHPMLSTTYPAYITWSNGSTNILLDTLYNTNSIADTLFNLTAGHYFVTITDGSCSNYGYYELTHPDSIKIETYVNDVSCYGQNSGSINLYVSGGNGQNGYIFNWSNGSTAAYYMYNLAAGNYSVTVSDMIGCSNTQNFTIHQPDSFIVNIIPVNVSCNGANDAYIIIHPQGGTQPYFYTLDSANSYSYIELTDTIIWLDYAGNYQLHIKDANYCDTISFTNILITEPSKLLIDTIQLTPPTCLNNDGTIYFEGMGGTGTYTYWINGVNYANNIVYNLSEGNYLLAIEDQNGCYVDSSIYVTKQSELPVIKGYVSYNQNPIDSAKVLLLQVGQFGAAIMDTIRVQGPNFDFYDIYPGSYYLKANYTGTNLNVWNTYYQHSPYWTDATMLQVSCNDTLQLNIELIQAPSITNGLCSMSGYVHFLNSKNGKAASEPVPGAEITVEQVPGPTIIKMALTDTTGFYNLNNLPDLSNCNLRVDIPGLPLLSTYTGLSVSSNGNANLTNLNFIVDTTTNGGIMKDSSLWANIQYSDIASIQIVPNPVINQANAEITIQSNQEINIYIMNSKGQLIDNLGKFKLKIGNNPIAISTHLLTGNETYYLVAQSDHNTYIKKFIKLSQK